VFVAPGDQRDPAEPEAAEPTPEPETFTATRYRHNVDADDAARRYALDAAIRLAATGHDTDVEKTAERFYAFLTKD
jgi:hypothetical protein